jgi:hypothetical protein
MTNSFPLSLWERTDSFAFSLWARTSPFPLSRRERARVRVD